MVNQNNNFENDYEFLDIILTIWKNKISIIIFSFISMILSGSYLYFIEINKNEEIPFYESKIMYVVDQIPPDHNNSNKVKKEFERLFYSIKTFNSWDINKTESYLFDSFGKFKLNNDGFSSLKGNSDLEVSLQLQHTNEPYILVRTSIKEDIIKIFNFAKYVSMLLDKNYISNYYYENELFDEKLSNKNLLKPNVTSTSEIYKIVEKQIFVSLLEEEGSIINIINPSRPSSLIKKGHNKLVVITFFMLIGVIVGIFYIFIRSAILKKNFKL